MLKNINHIAIIVPDIEAALVFWRDTLGIERITVEEVISQQVEVALLQIGDSSIELVRPTGDDSAAARYLTKHGPGLHHIALEVSDLDSLTKHLQVKGVRLLTETPVDASLGNRALFIHPESANGVLVELYQSD